MINLKQIEISILNLKIFIELNIICPNVEELSLYINDNFDFNKKEIMNIFNNIKTFKIYIKNKFDLIDLMREIKDSKIENLKIFDKSNKYEKNDSIIILNNIKKIIIEGNNEILFNNIQFPNLKEYELNLCNINENIIIKSDDFNSINIFLIEILKNRNIFILNDIINFPNRLKNIKYLKINLSIFSFIVNKNEYFEFKLYDTNYYSNYNISIDEKEISKYKKIKIEGISKLKKDNNLEIIENKNINLCDINLNMNKLYIKNIKEIRSIYCEEEIQNTNLISIIKDINEFKKLKYINLTIGYIKESPNDKNISNIYNYLSKLIKNSKNLKSLILRINSNNYYENICFYLSLIEDLKKLRILNINGEYELNEEILLNKFPKLKERKYYFKEFKINNNNYIDCIYDIKKLGETRILNYVKQNYKNISLYDEEEEMKEYFEIYLDDNKMDFCFKYNFENLKKYKIKIKCIKLLTNMGYMFYKCSSLTSLNLSNFNTNNVTNMGSMFYECSSLTSLNLSNFNTNNGTNMYGIFKGLNKNCKIISNDKKINKLKSSNLFF